MAKNEFIIILLKILNIIVTIINKVNQKSNGN